MTFEFKHGNSNGQTEEPVYPSYNAVGRTRVLVLGLCYSFREANSFWHSSAQLTPVTRTGETVRGPRRRCRIPGEGD